jgi:hypothetical protein
MNAIILKGAALRFHKVAPEPKQLPTPDLVDRTIDLCPVYEYRRLPLLRVHDVKQTSVHR